MPDYRLTYFNGKGRAEISRLILAYAGVKYTDDRLKEGTWPQHKANMPWGNVPVLYVDGKPLGQSQTINRYLAREHGLAGKDSLEMAYADEIVDVFRDLFDGYVKVMYGPADKKDAAMKVYLEETLPAVFAKLEGVFGRDMFLAGSNLTWADITAFDFCSKLTEKNPNILDKTPKLAKLIKYVAEIPNIKKWVEERPKTNL